MPDSATQPDLNDSPVKRNWGGARPGAGGKAFEPTQEQRTLVLALKGAGFSNESIATQIGPRGISVRTLEKKFAFELATGRTKIHSICVMGIVKAMLAGEAWALCFVAKTQLGWREKEVDTGIGSLDKLDEIARLAQHGPARAVAQPKETVM